MGIHAQLLGSPATTIVNNGIVAFDTVFTNVGGVVGYTLGSGIFTLMPNSVYYTSWFVAVDGAAGDVVAVFAISINGGTGPAAASPVVTGEVSGSALIQTGPAATTLSIVNRSGADFDYAATPVQANIVIMKAGA